MFLLWKLSSLPCVQKDLHLLTFVGEPYCRGPSDGKQGIPNEAVILLPVIVRGVPEVTTCSVSLGTIKAAFVEANQPGLVSLPSLHYAWCIVTTHRVSSGFTYSSKG